MRTKCRVLQLTAMAALIATQTALAAPVDTRPWIRVDPAALDGRALPSVPANIDALPHGYFADLEGPSNPKFLMIHYDHAQTAIFESLTGISRAYEFPGDEVVNVRGGAMTLIDEPSGRVQTFTTGDYYVVPKHWRGLWIYVSKAGTPAREFVQMSSGQWTMDQPVFDRAKVDRLAQAPGVQAVDVKAAAGMAKPISFDAPGTGAPAGNSLLGTIIFAGEPSLLFLKSPAPSTYDRKDTPCESVVRVMTGTVELRDGQRAQRFRPDEVFVVTRHFRGEMRLSAGFSALSEVVRGTQSANSPANSVAAVSQCPSI
jgi:hypothetical protein